MTYSTLPVAVLMLKDERRQHKRSRLRLLMCNHINIDIKLKLLFDIKPTQSLRSKYNNLANYKDGDIYCKS